MKRSRFTEEQIIAILRENEAGACSLVAGFLDDQIASGRRFRILNVVDDVTRECLAAIRTPRAPADGWREICLR